MVAEVPDLRQIIECMKRMATGQCMRASMLIRRNIDHISL